MKRLAPLGVSAMVLVACANGTDLGANTTNRPPDDGPVLGDPIFEEEGNEEAPGDAGPPDGGPQACPPAPSGWRPMASFATVGPATTSFTRLIAEPVWTGREALFVGMSSVPGCVTCEALVAGAYAPATDTWRTLPAPPLPIGVQLHAFWTGTTWVVFSSAAREATGAQLDLATERWTIIEDPPGTRRGAQAFAWVPATREVVMWGGLGRVETGVEETLNLGAAYSVETRRWRELPPSPLGPRMLARAAWDGRRVVFAWGFVFDPELEGQRAEAGVAAWDPTLNRWVSLPDPGVTPRLREVDATLLSGSSGLAAFFGGAPFIGDGDFFEHAADGVAWNGSTWVRIPDVPLAGHPFRDGYAWWVANARLYLWGGEAVQEDREPFFFVLDDGASWDPSTGAWTRLPSGGPVARSRAVALWTGCDAIVYGGVRLDVPFANDGMLLRP